MSRSSFFTATTEMKIERNNNAGSSERFIVTYLGMSAKGETLDSAVVKVANRLWNRAEALSTLPASALSEEGATEKAQLLSLFGTQDRA
jgi:hypothetical protein